MAKKNQSTHILGPVLLILVFTVLGVVLLIGYSDYLFGEAQDFYEMIDEKGAPVKGEHVSIGVDAVIDWYAETQHKINGFIPAGSEQHCVVWLDNDAFISMTIKGKKNIARVDEIIDATNDYLDYLDGYGDEAYLPSPVVFEGEITSIGHEVEEYYDDAMEILGVDNNDNFTVYYLTIDTTSTKGKMWLTIGLFGVLDVVFIVVLIANIKTRKRMKQAAAQTSYMPGQNAATDMYENINNAYGYGNTGSTYGTESSDNVYGSENADNVYGQMNSGYNNNDGGNNNPYV